MASKRKYLLFKADDGRPDGLKPCAFFFSPEGCRNGGKCKFSHTISTPAPMPAPTPAPAPVPTPAPPLARAPLPVQSAPRTHAPPQNVSAPIHPSGQIARAPAPVASKKPVSKYDTDSSSESSDESEDEKEKAKKAKKSSVANVNVVASKKPEHDALASLQTTMQEMLAKQQREYELKMEEQMKSFQLAMLAKSSVVPEPVVSPTIATPTPKSERNKKSTPTGNVSTPGNISGAKHSLGEDDEDSDTKFLFGAVNVALDQGRHSDNVVTTPSPSQGKGNNKRFVTAQQQQQRASQQQVQQHVHQSLPQNQFQYSGQTTPANFSQPVVPQFQPRMVPVVPVAPIVPVAAPRGVGNGNASILTAAPTLVTVPQSVLYNVSPAPLTVSQPIQPTSAMFSSMFVAPNDAMKSLSTSGTDHATLGPGKKQKPNPDSSSVPVASKPATALAIPPGLGTRTWLDLVQLTQIHPRYQEAYTFQTDQSWVASKPMGDWCKGKIIPEIIAVDCEMCQTVDPLTGAKDQSCLIRLSVVNGMEPSEVLIDTLVAPSWPVSDLRTSIHGITQEQMIGVSFTLRHAQAALLNICTENTILVGHGIHNDLKSLKLIHKRVVDTALLYSVEGESTHCPSLREVSDQILGVKLPDTHDSVEDAQAALSAARHLLTNHNPKPIIRKLNSNAASETLILHRIPENCGEDHIKELFVVLSNIIPTTVEPIVRSAGGNESSLTDQTQSPAPHGHNPVTGKTTVVFRTAAHADLAFESLVGPNRPDKSNRPQKRVYLRGGGYLCVRKA